MGNLFLSFTIAVCVAVGFATMSRAFDFEFYATRTLPLIPILYAIVYEVLERRKAGETGTSLHVRDRKSARVETPAIVGGLTIERVMMGTGVSFSVKLLIEMILAALFLRFSGQSFSGTYGPFTIETVGRFLRGEHPWLAGSQSVFLLALISLITCLIAGLWIGYTSRGKAIVEGVLVGAVVTVIMSMTNMLILYQKIETVTERLIGSMGFVLRAGFLTVLALQVLLYGLWSGVVQTGKSERTLMAAEIKARKRSKR
jgi:hypothetical protein